MNNLDKQIRQNWIGDTPADANSNDLFEQAKAYDLGIGVEEDKQKASIVKRWVKVTREQSTIFPFC